MQQRADHLLCGEGRRPIRATLEHHRVVPGSANGNLEGRWRRDALDRGAPGPRVRIASSPQNGRQARANALGTRVDVMYGAHCGLPESAPLGCLLRQVINLAAISLAVFVAFSSNA